MSSYTQVSNNDRSNEKKPIEVMTVKGPDKWTLDESWAEKLMYALIWGIQKPKNQK